MAKYQSQYTGVQIDEAIGKILNLNISPTLLPQVDVTSIHCDVIPTYSTIFDNDFDKSDTEQVNAMYNKYFIRIEEQIFETEEEGQKIKIIYDGFTPSLRYSTWDYYGVAYEETTLVHYKEIYLNDELVMTDVASSSDSFLTNFKIVEISSNSVDWVNSNVVPAYLTSISYDNNLYNIQKIPYLYEHSTTFTVLFDGEQTSITMRYYVDTPTVMRGNQIYTIISGWGHRVRFTRNEYSCYLSDYTNCKFSFIDENSNIKTFEIQAVLSDSFLS